MESEITQVQVGQEFVIKEEIKTSAALSGQETVIPVGAIGFVNNSGFVVLQHPREHYGKMLPLSKEHYEVKGFDEENISKMIVDQIWSAMSMEEYFEPEDKQYMMDSLSDLFWELF